MSDTGFSGRSEGPSPRRGSGVAESFRTIRPVLIPALLAASVGGVAAIGHSDLIRLSGSAAAVALAGTAFPAL